MLGLMIGGLGSALIMEEGEGKIGGVGDPFLSGSSRLGQAGSCFWSLVRGSPFLVRGSH